MRVPTDCEVAIIGAGPVGLFMANLMGLAGHRVVLLERNEGQGATLDPSAEGEHATVGPPDPRARRAWPGRRHKEPNA